MYAQTISFWWWVLCYNKQIMLIWSVFDILFPTNSNKTDFERVNFNTSTYFTRWLLFSSHKSSFLVFLYCLLQRYSEIYKSQTTDCHKHKQIQTLFEQHIILQLGILLIRYHLLIPKYTSKTNYLMVIQVH